MFNIMSPRNGSTTPYLNRYGRTNGANMPLKDDVFKNICDVFKLTPPTNLLDKIYTIQTDSPFHNNPQLIQEFCEHLNIIHHIVNNRDNIHYAIEAKQLTIKLIGKILYPNVAKFGEEQLNNINQIVEGLYYLCTHELDSNLFCGEVESQMTVSAGQIITAFGGSVNVTPLSKDDIEKLLKEISRLGHPISRISTQFSNGLLGNPFMDVDDAPLRGFVDPNGIRALSLVNKEWRKAILKRRVYTEPDGSRSKRFNASFERLPVVAKFDAQQPANKTPEAWRSFIATIRRNENHINSITVIGVTDAQLRELASAISESSPKIKSLTINSSPQLTDAGLAHIRSLTALTSLNLAGCESLTGDGLAHLQSLTALTSLSLERCESLTGDGLAHLQSLTALTSLNLAGCMGVTDAGLAHLQSLTALTELNLAGCSSLTDDGLAHLQSLTSLTELNLAGCWELTGDGLAHLQSLTALTSLNLAGCESLTGVGLEYLQSLTALTSLNLAGCMGVTDAGLAHIRSLTSLTSLSLERCRRLTGAGLAHLQRLTSLTELNLAGCVSLTGAGLAHLQRLTSLTSLNLAWCEKLTDAGLVHLQSLTALTSLSR